MYKINWIPCGSFGNIWCNFERMSPFKKMLFAVSTESSFLTSFEYCLVPIMLLVLLLNKFEHFLDFFEAAKREPHLLFLDNRLEPVRCNDLRMDVAIVYIIQNNNYKQNGSHGQKDGQKSRSQNGVVYVQGKINE